MILRRLAEAIRDQNWFTVLVEVLVVVVGIFLGLQVDDWNKARKDQERYSYYLTAMHKNLTFHRAGLQEEFEYHEHMFRYGNELIRQFGSPGEETTMPRQSVVKLFYVGNNYPPTDNNVVYAQMKSDGKSHLLDDELRVALNTFYLFTDFMRDFDPNKLEYRKFTRSLIDPVVQEEILADCLWTGHGNSRHDYATVCDAAPDRQEAEAILTAFLAEPDGVGLLRYRTSSLINVLQGYRIQIRDLDNLIAMVGKRMETAP